MNHEINPEEEKLRDQISKILIKWDLPTRQVAIMEIMQLLQPIEHCGVEECLECNQEAFKASRQSALSQVRNLVKTNKDAYMMPRTEERFLKDLAKLEE